MSMNVNIHKTRNWSTVLEGGKRWAEKKDHQKTENPEILTKAVCKYVLFLLPEKMKKNFKAFQLIARPSQDNLSIRDF